MSKTTRALLVLTIVNLATGFAFVTGVVKVGHAVGLYVTFPAGTILFGLFLISKMFEKETAVHDAEQRAALAAAKRSETSKSPVSKPCERSDHSHESLVSAH